MENNGGSSVVAQSGPRLGKGTLLLLLILAVVVAMGGWWGVKRVMWWTPTGHEIVSVVRDAIGVNETLLTPPQAYRNVPITPAQLQRWSRHAQRALADYFTGDELAFWRTTARRTLSVKDLRHGKNSNWMTTWKVDWVHFAELTLLPHSATATASAEFSSNLGGIDRLDYTMHLVRTHAGWRVDKMDLRFEPGYGP